MNSNQSKEDLKIYRVRGRFTILEVMAALAILGLAVTGLQMLWF